MMVLVVAFTMKTVVIIIKRSFGLLLRSTDR